MASPRVHIVGAGLAGLATAVRLAEAGCAVSVYEGAGQAGGRCRSYFDSALGVRLDNGNHLLLSGNTAAMGYLRQIGAGDALTGPERAEYPFYDLATGERWTVRPSAGPIPWWIFSARTRIPGTRIGDYLSALRLLRATPDVTVAELLGNTGELYRRFWEPLAVAALNTEPERGAAVLLRPVWAETFARGEAACRPRIARVGLSEAFVDPALSFLRAHGAEVRFNARLRGIETDAERVSVLTLAGADPIALAETDRVVLALPPAGVVALLPGIDAPVETRAIVNAHFRLPPAPPGPAVLGLIGGTSQWIFRRADVASVTISAADPLAEVESDQIAARIWPEVAAALGLGDVKPLGTRIVKEKRATFAQTPDQVRRRPGPGTPWKNLYLAGDWTDTGLPATIEGTIRSGNLAANRILAYATEP